MSVREWSLDCGLDQSVNFVLGFGNFVGNSITVSKEMD
ncbi:hypothetical protein M6B38_263450 [Iris pallida]|uniref:Uncharacterized protein n=1 Tax=Iris pallida TaxID=29817 RepID=A0AAX6IDV6_IRIPA|nr:hypothetical protein M6B38_263450 [Iris pallida]